MRVGAYGQLNMKNRIRLFQLYISIGAQALRPYGGRDEKRKIQTLPLAQTVRCGAKIWGQQKNGSVLVPIGDSPLPEIWSQTLADQCGEVR